MILKLDFVSAFGSSGDYTEVGLTSAEVADLITSYRSYGVFTGDISSGRVMYSRQAHEIVGIEFTGGPINIADILRKTHPEDASFVSSAFPATIRDRTGFHAIFRYNRDGEYIFLRLVTKWREGGDAGEITGIIYELHDYFRAAAF